MNYYDDLSLTHFGVKGMRWGVRKKQEPVSTGVAKTPMSSDAALTSKIRTKARTSGMSSLSNAELQALNQRLQLERQYSSLVGSPATKSGMDKVQNVMKVAGAVNSVVKLVNSPVGKAAIAMGKTAVTSALTYSVNKYMAKHV